MHDNSKSNYQIWLKNLQGTNLHEDLLKYSDHQIDDAFYKDIEFGTGGMRGELGLGTNRINVYTIRKAAEGFSRYLIKTGKENLSIAIAYDPRYQSKELTIAAAQILASHKITVYIFDDIRPTPELSFAVRYLKASGGIVITASHNPPQYNGFKLYDESGCQLVPHQSEKVIAEINQIDNIFSITPTSESTTSKYIKNIGKEIDDAYIKEILTLQTKPLSLKPTITAVFSSLHGTSIKIAPQLFKAAGYDAIEFVESQSIPDPEFSTVESPNPEEKGALKLAITQAQETGADIVMGTDPDADRIGTAVKTDSGYVLLSGNQTGALLLDYILERRKALNTLSKNGHVFNTIVTSDLGAQIAKKHGMKVISTLTGFKFIGEQIGLLNNPIKDFIFGYEESFGYLIGDFVRDKDSLQAALLILEMADFYKRNELTLFDRLNEIYQEYGYYADTLHTITKKGKQGLEEIETLMNDLRKSPQKTLASEDIVEIEDYLNQTRTTTTDIVRLDLPKSNVIKMKTDSDSWLVVRPSGTEPKLKIYISAIGTSLEHSQEKAEKMLEEIMKRVEKPKFFRQQRYK